MKSLSEALIGRHNDKNASKHSIEPKHIQEFLKVMEREGFSYDDESYKNQIRFYWRGSQHWLGNIVFIIYVNDDYTLDYVDWLSNKDLMPRYGKIIINAFKR